MQIVASLYALGGGNILLSALLWILQYVYPRGAGSQSSRTDSEGRLHRENWVAWTRETMGCVIPSSLATGYAILIAAITQRKTISHYHSFFAFLLADAVNGNLLIGPYGLMSRYREVQFETIYCTGYQVLWVVNAVITIRRLNDWRNEQGKCFITFPGGAGNLVEKENTILWMWICLVSNICSQFIVPLGEWAGLFAIWRPPRKAVRGTLILLFVQLPSLFMYIWDIYWALKLISANGALMVGSEDGDGGWGFGQVSAAVALVGWVREVVYSYLSKFSQSPNSLLTRLTRRD
jgi:hypothetical protein